MDNELVNEIKSFLESKQYVILKGEISSARYSICVDLLKEKYCRSVQEIAMIDDVVKWRVMTNAAFMVPHIIDFIVSDKKAVLTAYYNESIEIINYINLLCKKEQ